MINLQHMEEKIEATLANETPETLTDWLLTQRAAGKDLLDELLREITPREQARTSHRLVRAARIADALAAKGWNQRQLAEALGRKPSEIKKWLSGTHNFTIDTLSDLEEVLGVVL
jgi:ribosome-binding protein aMBF1 (putative translation factor)